MTLTPSKYPPVRTDLLSAKKRTFVVGDIHGDIDQLLALFGRLPEMTENDTLVFLGDYIDRGAKSAECVEFISNVLPKRTKAKLVPLRGNHEDAWIRVIEQGWPEFVTPPGNGCLACYRSYRGGPPPFEDELPTKEEFEALHRGSFFPPAHIEWMKKLPFWYEDEYAIYVHAGLPPYGDRFLHPSEVNAPAVLLWIRTEAFFRSYRGKPVVIGHTTTDQLPQELSSYTPEDPTDLWAGENVYALDTGCGKGGFLTALELPALQVYESRR